MFFGSIPALVTPFAAGRVDEAAFRDLVEWQIDEGSAALVPCGTTGEVATLERAEHHRLIALAVETARGRVPVIAGCGSYSTAASIAHIKAAARGRGQRRVGRRRLITTSRARPGSRRTFRAIAEASDLPIIVYNVPGRTVADISVETLAEVSQMPSVVGIKDASGNLARVTAQRLACGEEFCQLSGNDDMALGFNAMGGVGCISVTANVAPRLCADFQAATREGAGTRRSSCRTGSTRSTPRCSPMLRRARPNMRCRRSARISRPSCACR